jgi:hypothetical protein
VVFWGGGGRAHGRVSRGEGSSPVAARKRLGSLHAASGSSGGGRSSSSSGSGGGGGGGSSSAPRAPPDGARHQRDGLLARHVVLVARLKHGHGVERARAHGGVGQAVGGAVGIDLRVGRVGWGGRGVEGGGGAGCRGALWACAAGLAPGAARRWPRGLVQGPSRRTAGAGARARRRRQESRGRLAQAGLRNGPPGSAACSSRHGPSAARLCGRAGQAAGEARGRAGQGRAAHSV